MNLLRCLLDVGSLFTLQQDFDCFVEFPLARGMGIISAASFLVPREIKYYEHFFTVNQ